MRDLPTDPAFWPGTPEYEERVQLHRELRDSRAYDLQMMQEDYDYNHSYIPRRPGR